MTDYRQWVQIPDVPFYWSSSLTDDQIRRLYEKLLKQRFFLGLSPEEGLKYEDGMPTIVFGMRLKETVVEFEGKVYQIVLAGETVIVDQEASCSS